MAILISCRSPVNHAKRFLVLFIGFIFLSPFGCGPRAETPTDTLVAGIETAPLTLDPRLASDAASSKISRLLHNGLFRVSERFDLLPDLVEKFESSSPTKYTFHLRKGVLFHDGRELTASDVKFTLESVLDPSSIRILDPLTLEITLKEPFSPFLSVLTLGIVPAGRGAEIGTGPFQLESFRPNAWVRLKKNGAYFRDPPKVEKLVFRIIPDDNLRILELKNHRIDLLQNNVPPSLLGLLREDPDLLIEKTEGMNETYLGMNLKKTPLNKRQVRQAIAHALDLPSLMEYRMAGMARRATGVIAPLHWAYEPEVKSVPFDPKKSRDLLDEAGFPDPDGGGPAARFSLTYKTSTKKDRIGLARQIARYLQDVGIEVKILPLEWGAFFRDVNAGDFELYSLTWVGVTEPDIFYHAFHSAEKPPAGGNRGGYANPEVDRLTEKGRRAMDRSERKGIYSVVQKILAADLPAIPLWYEENFAVFSRRIKGLKLRPDASFDWAVEVSKEPE